MPRKHSRVIEPKQRAFKYFQRTIKNLERFAKSYALCIFTNFVAKRGVKEVHADTLFVVWPVSSGVLIRGLGRGHKFGYWFMVLGFRLWYTYLDKIYLYRIFFSIVDLKLELTYMLRLREFSSHLCFSDLKWWYKA